MLALVLAAAATAGCGLPPMLSDTGYRGTWARRNEHNVSIVAIAEVDGQYRLRWTKRSFDGKQSILCDWEGRCREEFEGRPAATFTIATTYDPATNELATHTAEDREFPSKQHYEYRDVMEVADAGRTLWNYTTDRDGRHFDGGARPMRSFTKISNSVAAPPRPARP